MSIVLPNADDIARALVAACRETGENPIRAASGEVGGPNGPNIRARHYAMHALLHVFPDLGRHEAARMVGCPGSPAQFWNSSWHQIAKPSVSGLRRAAGWWDEEAYGRVIAAIENDREPIKTSPEHRETNLRSSEPLIMRRQPATVFDDVTAALMGDPPPGSSALDRKRERAAQ